MTRAVITGVLLVCAMLAPTGAHGQTLAPSLVHSFTIPAAAGWTKTNCTVVDANSSSQGNGTALAITKGTADGYGSLSIALPHDVDISTAKLIRFRFYIYPGTDGTATSWQGLCTLQIQLNSMWGSNEYAGYTYGPATQGPGWYEIDLPTTQPSTRTAALNAIDNITIMVTGRAVGAITATAAAPSVTLDSISAYSDTAKPVVMFRFDDGYAIQKGAIEYLNARGLHATILYGSGRTSAGGYLSPTEVQALQAAGNLVVNHLSLSMHNHHITGYAGVSTADVVADFQANKLWMQQLGLVKGAGYFALPGGKWLVDWDKGFAGIPDMVWGIDGPNGEDRIQTQTKPNWMDCYETPILETGDPWANGVTYSTDTVVTAVRNGQITTRSCLVAHRAGGDEEWSPSKTYQPGARVWRGAPNGNTFKARVTTTPGATPEGSGLAEWDMDNDSPGQILGNHWWAYWATANGQAEVYSTMTDLLTQAIASNSVFASYWHQDGISAADIADPTSYFQRYVAYVQAKIAAGQLRCVTPDVLMAERFGPSAPVFSAHGGKYPTAQHIVITCATAGATIHYTTNGRDPTEGDPVVASGASVLVNVNPGTMLKARAFETGFGESDVSEAVYRIPIVYVSPSGSDSNDGGTWATAKTTLQGGIDAADAGDEIWVAAGTYKPTSDYGLGTGGRGRHFEMKNGVGIYGGFSGSETLREQRDWRANVTVLSGDLRESNDPNTNNRSFHVLYLPMSLGLVSSAVLDGFVITGGNADGAYLPHNSGGGVYMCGSPTIANCTITLNKARLEGGGMYCDGTTGYDLPDVNGCIIAGCTAPSGGGVYSNAGNFNNCVMVGNAGGALACDQGGRPYLMNCTVSGNGGPVVINGPAVMGNCIITDPITGGWPPMVSYCYRGNSPGFVRSPNAGGDGVWGTNDDYYGNLRLVAGSPCIDAGANSWTSNFTTDILGNPRIVNGDANGVPVVDIGAYERQCVANPIGDISYDCGVGFADYAILAGWWNRGDCGAGNSWCYGADIDRDGNVDMMDAAILAAHWMEGM